jgi:hypothetical protein
MGIVGFLVLDVGADVYCEAIQNNTQAEVLVPDAARHFHYTFSEVAYVLG